MFVDTIFFFDIPLLYALIDSSTKDMLFLSNEYETANKQGPDNRALILLKVTLENVKKIGISLTLNMTI